MVQYNVSSTPRKRGATFTTRGQNIGRAGAKSPPLNDNSKELQQSLSIAIIMLVLSLRLLTLYVVTGPVWAPEPFGLKYVSICI
jgi:hypothetical protein